MIICLVIRRWGQKMKNIFIGFILVMLDLNFTFGNSHIDILPDFVGYIVMIKGLVEMAEESHFFMETKPYVTGMALYSGFLFFIDITGIYMSLGALTTILALLSNFISLYISYKIVMGVIDMEGKHNSNMNGQKLKSRWTAYAVLNLLAYISLLIPTISVIFLITGVIAFICFLYAFNESKKLYYATIG